MSKRILFVGSVCGGRGREFEDFPVMPSVAHEIERDDNRSVLVFETILIGQFSFQESSSPLWKREHGGILYSQPGNCDTPSGTAVKSQPEEPQSYIDR
jgi:hypothetical protein